MRTLRLVIALTLVLPAAARAFCGFYVGKAGAQLFNKASQVVLARDGDRTIVTMSNDFRGTLTDFALVVPVPSVITKEQIHIGDRGHIERLDAWSSPRLVEYYDENPCQQRMYEERAGAAQGAPSAKADDAMSRRREHSLGVTVDAQYTVGEYDIVILSAKQSQGLATWLVDSGYNIPRKSARALEPYIKQDMKFFVAKVNLKEQKSAGFHYLRPIQIAYESKKFMLPIRLGMANADGPQDLVIYALSRTGRVESANYRTVKVPTGQNVPLFVRGEFDSFYRALFEKTWKKEGQRALLTEYVWDTGWCDPCAASPLSADELHGLGVFWDTQGTVVTRLHVRYDEQHFPEDLVLQQTGDRENFQARYVLQIPWTGGDECAAAAVYREQLDERHRQEAITLAQLTGWHEKAIQQKMGGDAPHPRRDSWWRKIWQ